MGVILNIFSILLTILFCIILLIVVLGVAVLVLPIKYQLEGSRYENVRIKAIVKVFYILRIRFEMEDENQQMIATLFGRKIYIYKESGEQEESGQEETKQEEYRKDKSVTEVSKTKESSKQPEKKEPPLKQQKPLEEQRRNTSQKVVQEEDKSEGIKEENQFKKIVKIIKALWEDENRQEFFGRLKDLVCRLFVAIRPKSLYFDVIVGADNPADTGEWIAKSTVAYPLYAKYGTIQGNFEEEGIWGEGEIEGKFNIYKLVKPLIIFISNKSVREYIRLIVNIGRNEEDVE